MVLPNGHPPHWTSAEFFEIDGNTCLFRLKEVDGDVHIHRMNSDGSVGDVVYENEARWTSGWTSAKFFQNDGSLYLILLKQSNGDVHVHRVSRSVSTAGSEAISFSDPAVYDSNESWSSGWTSAEFYDENGCTFLITVMSD
jgi:hypothetical protein